MTTANIRFMKHYVTNGTEKARVIYSAFRMVSTGENCVTLYAKDFRDGRALAGIIGEGYENNTDSQTDYFEQGRAWIKEGHPLYAAALERARANGNAG